MRRSAAVVALAGALLAAPAGAADRGVGLRLAGSYDQPNPGGLFYLDDSRYDSLQEVFGSYVRDGLVAGGSLVRRKQEGQAPTVEGVLTELYLDTSLGDWDLTLGKKRLGWGVGFGFRPLDVITPEPRRALIPTPVEGLPLLALERYSGEQAITALCGNNFSLNANGFALGDTQCALRYFGLVGDWDVQALIHRHPEVRWQAGAGFARTIGESVSLHGSLLYQRQYLKWINPLTERDGLPVAKADPMEQRRFEHGIKALIGLGYTSAGGHSWLIEYWRDDAGYTKSEWDAQRRLILAQRALLGTGAAPEAAIQGNIAANLRVLNQTNLLRDNLLLRWSYDGGAFDPALDLLYTPADGGLMITAGAEGELPGGGRLNFGLRYYGGDADSMSRALPDRYRVYVSFSQQFDW